MSTNAAAVDPARSAPAEERVDKMPRGIPFIISNEFAERFCFYGINSILVLYLTESMHFTDSAGTAWQAKFKAGAYFFPLVGAIVSDVLLGKFRTIVWFSLCYAAGCVALALFGQTPAALAASLLFVAFGTGGIKPCVSTNVGDQFTSKNQHLIERAFSYFYMSINAGSSISIYLCPWLLHNPKWGPKWAFGLPAAMMLLATLVFVAGRKRYLHVPPAGKVWLRDIFSKEGVAIILRLLGIYLFVTVFWMLWDQSNGGTWTLQARSPLLDKHPFSWSLLPDFLRHFELDPAQVQVVNGLFILAFAPIFSYRIYPFVERFFKVTPLRKIGVGLFVTAASYLVIASIERRIQGGETVSVWWQIFAYAILTCGEILVSITALEFSYKQAPLRMKSFIMALFLCSTSAGNLLIGAVNDSMVKPLHASAIQAAETWVKLAEAKDFVTGQKIDVTGETGLLVVGKDGKTIDKSGKPNKLAGTFIVAEIDRADSRVRLMDIETRGPVSTIGTYNPKAQVSTYYLVGPMYFLFFIAVMCVAGVIFIFYAVWFKEQTFVRT